MRILRAGLYGAASLLGVQIAVELWRVGPDNPGMARGAIGKPARLPPPPGRTADLEAVLRARPPFDASRRPGAVALETAEMVPVPRLAATILTAGGERVAIFAPQGAERSVTTHEGDRAAGLLVVTIAAGSVVAEDKAGRLVLRVGFTAREQAVPAAESPMLPHFPTNQDE